MFLLLLLPLLKTSIALNFTTSPLPTSGSLQSWTPNISSARTSSALVSQTITSHQSYSSFSSQLSTETPTNIPQYTYISSFSPSPVQTQISASPVQTQISASPVQTQISASPNQTQTSTFTSEPQASSQVSIYDTLIFKTGVGISVGVIILAIFIFCPSPLRKPLGLEQTMPVVEQTNPVTSMNNPVHTDIVSGKLLADGWKSVTDETGDVWYVNSVTGESSWVPTYKK